MKPINIVLLLLAGAIGGAVVMLFTQRPVPKAALVARAVPEAAPAAPAPAPAPVATTPVENTPVVTVAVESAQPAWIPAPAAPLKRAKPVVRPLHEKRPSPFQRPPELVAGVPRQDPVPGAPEKAAPEKAANEPAASQPPPPEPPSPEPASPEPASPEPAAPARPEVEHVTPPPAPPEPEPAPNTVTLNTGMSIPVRLLDGLSTERNRLGDTFVANLDSPLVAEGFVIAERGALVEGRVVSVDKGTGVRGGATIAVTLDRIRTSDNQSVIIQTDSFEKRSQPNSTRDAEKVAGGAAIGAVIGAIAGGGKGAAIGAGAGGGLGAGDVMLTRQPARLPSETRITFHLRAPVTLTERRQ